MPTLEAKLKVKGPEIQIGDVMRVRISKFLPWSWLKVKSLTAPTRFGTVGVSLENGGYDRVLRSETRWVRRVQA